MTTGDDDHHGALQLIEHGLLSGDAYGATKFALDLRVDEHVPLILYRLWHEGRIGEADLQDVVACVWVNNRSPTAGLSRRRWVELFKAAGPIIRSEVAIDGDDEQLPPEFAPLTTMPTEPMTVWRGAAL